MKIRSLFKKWQKNEDGATALVYAISAPALIGLLSIAFEIGHFQQRNARIQSAADMAAMATALEYQLTKNRGKAILEGKGNAYENGYVGTEGSIRVESPIVSGPYAGEEGAIVHITQEQERYFSKIFGSQTKVTHKVESTVLQMGGQPICMLALHPTNAGAITVTGSATLEMEDCAMHTNSNAMSAYNLSGSASVTADCISATGTIEGGAGATLSNCDRPKNYEPVISDPYADIEVPNNVASMPCLTPSFQSGGSIKMGAGRYCNKDFGLRGVLELTEKGVYIFDGVSVFFKTKGSMVGPPEGVTLIFMNGARLENTNGGPWNSMLNLMVLMPEFSCTPIARRVIEMLLFE